MHIEHDDGFHINTVPMGYNNHIPIKEHQKYIVQIAGGYETKGKRIFRDDENLD